MSKSNAVFKGAYNTCLGQLKVGEKLPSEAGLATQLGISRTTVRTVLGTLSDAGIVAWDGSSKLVLRQPTAADYFPDSETDPLQAMIERSFMRRVLSKGASPGDQINEADFAREIGVSTSAVREFLLRFSRFGLIEKQPNRRWVLKGFTDAFALELFEVREMFEVRSAQAFVRLPSGSRGLDRSRPDRDGTSGSARRHREALPRVLRPRRSLPPPHPPSLAQPLHRRLSTT